jgi:putative integral membrane protein (TIGR02587 family)
MELNGQQQSEQESSQRFWRGLARAFGGAIIFSLPMMMTMEMWYPGFYIAPSRLALLLLLGIPLLIGLSHFSGFRQTFRPLDDVVDAFVADAVGFVSATALMLMLALLDFGMSLDEVTGRVALQALPGAIGAMLARSQLGIGREDEERKKREAGYGGETFPMIVGALFLAFNVAPTEEMILIAFQMSEWHAITLAIVSLLIMHAFVYAMEFEGQASVPPGTHWQSVFLRFTLSGYALALLISLYALWTFGRTQGTALSEIVMMTVVLGFPAAVGAAAARLII